MLVLTRKVGEQIRIGEDILVTVLDMTKGNVRLGIEAPRQVSIHRHEVYERILDENLRASKGAISRGAVSDIQNVANIWREKQDKE